jgi:uncharacterized protein (DUF1697 family)
MPDHVAFLRAINVGGHRLPNADLRAHVAALGFGEVAVYQASGNVVLSGDGAGEPEIARRLEEGLRDALGYEVPVLVRSAEEVRAIAAAQPFPPAAVAASRGKLQVLLLRERPGAAARRAVLAHASEQDRLALGDRELFWLPSGGLLESPLDLKAIGRELGLSTTRTKGTIERLAARFF